MRIAFTPIIACLMILPLLLLPLPAAGSEVPDPSCCSTSIDAAQRVLMVPDDAGSQAARFSVTIRNADCQPMQFVWVEVLVDPQNHGEALLCGETILQKNTDANGYAEFEILGGGCVLGNETVVLRANGVVFRYFNRLMSPDYAGWDNQGLPGRANLSITPEDLAAFMHAYQGGAGPASCHDYSNNGVTDPPDLAVFVACYKGGAAACQR